MYNAKAYHREYYLKNREIILNRSKLRWVNQKDKIIEYLKEYKEKEGYKEQHAKYHKIWYNRKKEKNPEYFKTEGKKRLKWHAEWTREYRRKNRAWYLATKQRRHVLEKNGSGITKMDIENQLIQQGYKCFYCHIDITDNYTVDHLIPLFKKGTNTSDNFVLACKHCNCSKGIKLPEEYQQYILGQVFQEEQNERNKK